MTDRADLKLMAQHAVGLSDISLAPDVVLALIAENERLHLDNSSLRGSCARLGAEHAAMSRNFKKANRMQFEARADRDRLKVENDALRRERDARHPLKPFHEPAIGFPGCVICGVYTDHGGLPCPKTRATADAALGKGER